MSKASTPLAGFLTGCTLVWAIYKRADAVIVDRSGKEKVNPRAGQPTSVTVLVTVPSGADTAHAAMRLARPRSIMRERDGSTAYRWDYMPVSDFADKLDNNGAVSQPGFLSTAIAQGCAARSTAQARPAALDIAALEAQVS